MYILPYHIIIMFERKTQIQKDCKTTTENIIDLIKIVEKSQDLVALTGIYEALFKGKIQVPALEKQLEPKIQEVEIDEAPISATKQIAQKTKINQDVFRYFLQDDSKKGICSAQIKRICGKKAIWKRSLSGKKNQYVSGIEGMKSDKVDEVMAQFKNLETYFVKSPYKAKIWNRQI